MALDTVDALVETLRRHQLLETVYLDELARQPPPATADPRAWAEELRQRGWLTPYQVQQLFQEGAAGLVLGSYVLREPLGEGAMGTVFVAKHQKLDRLVALKVIRPQWLTHRDAVRRFHREIQATALLVHPNV